MCYWQENTFFVLLQENIKYSMYWLFQRISKKVKFESVLEYRGLIFFGAKGLWQHLLCGWIRWRARWGKSSVLIGYPSTSCLFGISLVSPARKNYLFRHIINLFMTNRLVRSRWLDIGHFLSYVFIDFAFVLEEKWKIYNTTFRGPHDSINKWDVNNISIDERQEMRRNIFTYWLSKHFGSQGIGLHI